MIDIHKALIQWPSGHQQPAWPLIGLQVRAMVPLLLVGSNHALLLQMARHAVEKMSHMTSAEQQSCDATRRAANLDDLEPWQRPVRAPHFTCSREAIFGHRYLPGELGLACHGVLILDQVLEFRRSIVADIIHHSKLHPGAMIIGTSEPAAGLITSNSMAREAAFFGLVLNIVEPS